MLVTSAGSPSMGFQDLSLMPPVDGQELWRWLYTELRAAILDGRLKRGARMPSTRGLAKQYSLSRGTVAAAFDQLHGEGYTRTQVGAGTFVASGLPDHAMSPKENRRVPDLPKSTAALSKRAQRMVEGVRLALILGFAGCSGSELKRGVGVLCRGS